MREIPKVGDWIIGEVFYANGRRKVLAQKVGLVLVNWFTTKPEHFSYSSYWSSPYWRNTNKVVKILYGIEE